MSTFYGSGPQRLRAWKLPAWLVLCALTCTSSIAGTALLQWTAPAANVDGSPLAQPLTYKALYGCGPSGYPSQTAPIVDTTYLVEGLPDAGTCRFVVTATDNLARTSAPSNEASKVMGPEPPPLKPAGRAGAAVSWQPSQVAAVAIAFVTGTAASAQGLTADPVTTAALTTTGVQLLVATVGFYPDNGGALASELVTITDSKGNTWQRAGTRTTISGADAVEIWYSVPTSVGTLHTFSADFEAATYATLCVAGYNGFTGTPTLDQVVGNTGSGNSLDGGNLVTTVAAELLVSGGTDLGVTGGGFSAGTNFTLRTQGALGSSSTATGYLEDRIVSSTGTYATPATSDGDSSSWAARGASFYDAVGGTTYNQSVEGTITLAGALLKQPRLNPAGTVTSAGALVLSTGKVLAGTVTIAGTLAALRTVLVSLTGSISVAGALVLRTGKDLAGTIASSGAMTRLTGKVLAGTVTSAGALSAIRTLLVSVSGSVGIAGTLVRQAAKDLAGTITSSGALQRLTGKVLAGSVSMSGALTAVRTFFVALTGSVSISGTLVRSTSKLLDGTVIIAGAVTRAISKFLSGVVGIAGAVTNSSSSAQPTTDLEASSRDVLASEASSRDILDLGTDE